ncbi:hypothetical protein [Actinomadura sp. SCN-SB]|uniref:hypothetical protein n=1 Tax=Actinomadura sp. SCN-SB TaxID=3373092 RepID=UPI003751F36E
MSLFIVLRLRPVEPVGPVEFQEYLEGLTITAVDRRLAAAREDEEVRLGSATYRPPLPDWEPNPLTTIVQHVVPRGLPPVPVPFSVATAVIEVTGQRAEFGNSDVRLEFSRADGQFVRHEVYYNVPSVELADAPTPGEYRRLEPTSLYLALPAPPPEDADPGMYIELPPDGTPPPFDRLRTAVEAVLTAEPAPDGLAGLTARQARHVANEIIANQRFRPLPTPEGAAHDQQIAKLEEMYTGRKAAEDDQDRSQFEGTLLSYYATADADAERLTGYVFALSAAVRAEDLSGKARQAGLLFPVLPGPAATGTRFQQIRVVLDDVARDAVVNADFTVPAAYFYALGAVLSPSIDGVQRYALATYEEEARLLVALNAAAEARVIDPVTIELSDRADPDDPQPLKVGIPQAVRRLRALGAVQGTAPHADLDDAASIRDAVRAWLRFEGGDISAFWQRQELAEEHLDLVLLALTDGHVVEGGTPLSQAIKDELGVDSAPELAAKTPVDWQGFFRDDAGQVLTSRLPAFTRPGEPDERVAAFVQHVQRFFAAEPAGARNPGGTEPARRRCSGRWRTTGSWRSERPTAPTSTSLSRSTRAGWRRRWGWCSLTIRWPGHGWSRPFRRSTSCPCWPWTCRKSCASRCWRPCTHGGSPARRRSRLSRWRSSALRWRAARRTSTPRPSMDGRSGKRTKRSRRRASAP